MNHLRKGLHYVQWKIQQILLMATMNRQKSTEQYNKRNDDNSRLLLKINPLRKEIGLFGCRMIPSD